MASLPPLDPDTPVVATGRHVASRMGQEVVILGLERSEYYGLQGVAALIWELVQTPRTPAEVRDAVLRRYPIDQAQCERDVLRFLEELRGEGLLQAAR